MAAQVLKNQAAWRKWTVLINRHELRAVIVQFKNYHIIL